MRWYWIFIVALMSTLVTGCGSGDTASDVTELDEDETSSQLVDGPAADVELSVVSEVEKFTPPFPMNSSFFSQPEVEKAVVTPNSFNVADGEHANVRVIGFTQIGDGETQALISIRGSLRSVRTGDSIDGVSVVAIDAPRLTLQQRNERWTVALFNQPLVNQYASASSTAGSRGPASGRSPLAGSSATERSNVAGDAFEGTRSFLQGVYRGSSGATPDQASRSNLPPTPVSLPTDAFATAIELPEGLDLPDLPELPTIENMEDQRLPGIDDIPSLPSF
jgi:hypothetical protein